MSRANQPCNETGRRLVARDDRSRREQIEVIVHAGADDVAIEAGGRPDAVHEERLACNRRREAKAARDAAAIGGGAEVVVQIFGLGAPVRVQTYNQ